MHAKVTTSGEALLTVAKCTAAPDLIESVRARTDYTEEEKIHLEDMIDRTEVRPSPLLATNIYTDDRNIRAPRSISLRRTGRAARRRNWPTSTPENTDCISSVCVLCTTQS
mgnify:CR=1 FL=1|jgi:hypothetical protein